MILSPGCAAAAPARPGANRWHPGRGGLGLLDRPVRGCSLVTVSVVVVGVVPLPANPLSHCRMDPRAHANTQSVRHSFRPACPVKVEATVHDPRDRNGHFGAGTRRTTPDGYQARAPVTRSPPRFATAGTRLVARSVDSLRTRCQFPAGVTGGGTTSVPPIHSSERESRTAGCDLQLSGPSLVRLRIASRNRPTSSGRS